jgi:MFS superfamily sulfate permease-like transporter
MNKLTDFAKGIIVGVVISVIIFGLTTAFYFLKRKDKELIEYAEKQIEIQVLREDYINRDPVEFFEVPGVRGAADGASADFLRKRDEAVQRFRDKYSD